MSNVTPIVTAIITEGDLAVGCPIIHLSHGDGKIINFDATRQRITAEFLSDSATGYSHMWRSLVPMIGYPEPASEVESHSSSSSAPLRITVPIAIIRDATSWVWTIPVISNDYKALRRHIVTGISEGDITVDLDALKSTEFGEHFSRTLLELKYVDRADVDDMTFAANKVVDFVTARYLRGLHAKKGPVRASEFQHAIAHSGTDLWSSVVYVSGTSQAMRRELDKVMMSLVMVSCADMENKKELRSMARKLVKAVEFRIDDKFKSEFIRRSTMLTGIPAAYTEDDAIAASA